MTEVHLHELVELTPDADGRRRRLQPAVGLLFTGDGDCRVTPAGPSEIARMLRDERAAVPGLAEVIRLPDARTRALASEWNVSAAFVDLCTDRGIAVREAREILAWFLTMPPSARLVVMKTILRGVHASARKRKR